MSYLDHFLKEQAADHGVLSGNDVDNMNNGVGNQSVSNQVSLAYFILFYLNLLFYFMKVIEKFQISKPL